MDRAKNGRPLTQEERDSLLVNLDYSTLYLFHCENCNDEYIATEEEFKNQKKICCFCEACTKVSEKG